MPTTSPIHNTLRDTAHSHTVVLHYHKPLTKRIPASSGNKYDKIL